MTLTIGQIRAHVQLAVGGDPSVAPGITVPERIAEIINIAGEHLMTHKWRWRERTTTGIDTVAGQSYLDLPSDIGEIVEVVPQNAWSTTLQFVSPTKFEQLKHSWIETSLSYITTLVYISEGGIAVPKLDIYPTPSSAFTDAFYIRYRSAWAKLTSTQVDSTGASDTDTIPTDIPAFVEGLLLEYIRAVAEGGEDGSTQKRIFEVDNGTLLDRAQRKDGGFVSDYGALPLDIHHQGSSPGLYGSGVVSNPTSSNILWRGTWSASTSYSINDIVHYTGTGNSYIALTDNLNKQPDTNPSDWDIFTSS